MPDNNNNIFDPFVNSDTSSMMNLGGISESVQTANDILASVPPATPVSNESLTENLKTLASIKFPTFQPSSYSFGGSGISLSGKSQMNDLFSIDSIGKDKPSFEYEVRREDVYDDLGINSFTAKRDNGGLLGAGGGFLAGATAGAGVGATVGAAFGGVGALPGAIIGGILGGIAGGYEGSTAGKYMGYGRVRRKDLEPNQERLAQEQSILGPGLTRLMHNADGMVLGTINTLYHIPEAVASGSMNVLWNNDFSKFLNTYDKVSEWDNKIYHSKAYDNASLLGQVTHKEWLGEVLMPGLGYLLGAIGVGRLTGGAMSGMGFTSTASGATRAAFGETIGAAVKGQTEKLAMKSLSTAFKAAVKQDLAKATIKSSIGNMGAILTSAVPEAAMEARNMAQDAENSFVRNIKATYGRNPTQDELVAFHNNLLDMGNMSFVANTAVVGMSNWMQFGDLIGVNKVVNKGYVNSAFDKVFGLGVKQTVGDISETGIRKATWDAIKRSTLQKVAHRSFQALRTPVTEGLWEEGMQNVISNTAQTYLESRHNPQATEVNKTLIKSFGDSLIQTYSSRDGWNEILAGMVIGGLGSVRVNGGKADFLGQREVSERVREGIENAKRLNITQEGLEGAVGDYLANQGIYNSLNLESFTRLNDRIASSNQQIYNSEIAKISASNGNLEQAQRNLHNAMFAKLSAEKRAGNTKDAIFDIEMMVDNIPNEMLEQQYGFTTEEQIEAFKDQTKEDFKTIKEKFDVAYDVAETMNLGSGDTRLTPSQVTEMAALHVYHGLSSFDNATTIGKAIQNATGIGGVADVLKYYSNLSDRTQNQVEELSNKNDQLKELERRHEELLNSFSKASETPIRQTENEQTVDQLDSINRKMAGVQAEMDALNSEIARLRDILNSSESAPQLPFGNAAYKYLNQDDLETANTDVDTVMNTLQALDKYIEHLKDNTGKTETQQGDDLNKASLLTNMVTNYKDQMLMMRNFAKVANMLNDKSYHNNIFKGWFRNKKYDSIFNNDDWIKFDKNGLDASNVQEIEMLRQKVKDGELSTFDLHTYITNTNLLSMGEKITQLDDSNVVNEVISPEEMLELFNDDKEIDIESDIFPDIKDDIVNRLTNNELLTPNQTIVYNAAKDLIDEEVAKNKQEIETTPETLAEPSRNARLAEEQRLREIYEAKVKEINDRYDSQIDSIVEDLEKSSPISEMVLTDDMTMDEALDERNRPMIQLEESRANEIREAKDMLDEALNPTREVTNQINSELDNINNFIEDLIKDLKSELKEIDVSFVDQFGVSEKKIKDSFDRYNELAKKETKTGEEVEELQKLNGDINSLGLVEGRMADYGDQPVRLSDLLDQRASLESEYFNKANHFDTVTPVEITSSTHETPKIIGSGKGGDPSVLNNYDFATFSLNQNGFVNISNLTPQGLISELGKNNSIVSIEVNGNQLLSDINNEDFNDNFSEGNDIIVTYTPPTGENLQVQFSLDSSKRIVLAPDFMDQVQDTTDFRFDTASPIGSSGYYVLGKNDGGVVSHTPSDFTIASLIDSPAAQRLNPGDEITFRVDLNDDFNQGLQAPISEMQDEGALSADEETEIETISPIIEEYNNTNSEIERLTAQNTIDTETATALSEQIDNANETEVEDRASYNKDVVYPMMDQRDNLEDSIEERLELIKSLKSKLKTIKDSLKPLYGSKTISQIKARISQLISASELSRNKSTPELDEAHREMKNNMRIMAVDKNGNNIGIVKALSNSSSQTSNYLDNLRSAVYTSLREGGEEVKLPVQIVYMGIPNQSSTEGVKDTYRFSTDKGDGLIDPARIKDVGYVTYNGYKLKSGKSINTPYNYAKKFMDSEAYSNKRIPVVSFIHEGKEIIYPIRLEAVNGSQELIGAFDRLTNETEKDFNTYVKDINEFLASNGVSPKFRLSSLNFTDAKVAEIRNLVSNLTKKPTIDELVGSNNFRQILSESGIIDINLNDNPFIGPKVKFDITQAPTIQGDSNVSVPENSDLISEVSDVKDNNECK